MTLPVRHVVGALLIAMLACAGAAQAAPLRILVTNDDGAGSTASGISRGSSP